MRFDLRTHTGTLTSHAQVPDGRKARAGAQSAKVALKSAIENLNKVNPTRCFRARLSCFPLRRPFFPVRTRLSTTSSSGRSTWSWPEQWHLSSGAPHHTPLAWAGPFRRGQHGGEEHKEATPSSSKSGRTGVRSRTDEGRFAYSDLYALSYDFRRVQHASVKRESVTVGAKLCCFVCVKLLNRSLSS